MIAGMTLDALGEAIITQNAQKRDLIVPTSKLSMVATGRDTPALSFDLNGVGITADLTQHTIRQLGTWAGIPAKYFDRLNEADHRSLLEQNVNHWLKANDERRMLRMFQNGHTVARAFLSDSYRPLDNYDLAAQIMPKLKEAGMEIKSATLAETKLYIQAVDTRLMATIRSKGNVSDTLYGGVVVSNSEVGDGALKIESLLYRLVCTNGMIAGTSLRKSHLGRGYDSDSDDVYEILSDNTKAKHDEAFWLVVADVLANALSESKFREIVSKFENATRVELPPDPGHIVEVTAKRLDLAEGEKDAMLRHLFAGGDSSLFGVVNAITATAESDAATYDRAVELERLGWTALTTFTADTFAKN